MWVSCLPIPTDGTASAPQRSFHTVVASPPLSVAFCDSIDTELSFTFSRHIRWKWMDGLLNGLMTRVMATTQLFGKTKSSFSGNGKKLMIPAWLSPDDAMSIMMCIDYLCTPWLPVTCPFFHPSFLLNDSIHISVTVMRLYLLFRKWKSSIWPLYPTSGLVLCCVGLQIDCAVAPFHAAILFLFLHLFKDFILSFNIFYSWQEFAYISQA